MEKDSNEEEVRTSSTEKEVEAAKGESSKSDEEAEMPEEFDYPSSSIQPGNEEAVMAPPFEPLNWLEPEITPSETPIQSQSIFSFLSTQTKSNQIST